VLVYNIDKPNNILRKRQTNSLATRADGTVKGVNWTTTRHEDKLNCILSIDPKARQRKLRLLKPIQEDSTLIVDVLLNANSPWRSVLMPTDSSVEMETLYLFEDTLLIGKQSFTLKSSKDFVRINPDTVNRGSAGYNSWEIHVLDSNIHYAVLSVSDADRSDSAPLSIDYLKKPSTEKVYITTKLGDSSFIQLMVTPYVNLVKKLKIHMQEIWCSLLQTIPTFCSSKLCQLT
jgi:hypothetical protein